jgi:hypothetical protein
VGKYGTLGSAFDRIFRNTLNIAFDDVDTDIQAQKKRVDDLIKGTPQPSEVVDSRGGFPVLGDRLNDLTSNLAKVARLIGINITQPPYNCSPGTDISAKMVDIWNEAVTKNIPIYVPTGTFIMAFTPTTDNVTIVGEGKGKTILQSPNGSTKCFNISQRSNIHVQGITFDGNKLTAGEVIVVAVECGGTSSSSFFDCEFNNSSNSGVHVTSVVDVSFTKCNFLNNGLEHPEANSGDGLITYNNIVQNLRVTECSFRGNWRNGISLDLVTGGYADIDNCIFQGNSRGIHIEECSPSFVAKISKCHSYSNKGAAYGTDKNYGFFVGANNAGWFNNVTISDCSATDNYHGILLNTISGVKLVNCDLYENTMSGLSLGEARLNTFVGGSIVNNYQYGINSDNGMQSNVFQNIIIGDTQTDPALKTQQYGIVLKTYDDKNIVIGCIFSGNKTNYVSDGQDPDLFNKTEFVSCVIA